MKEDVLTLDDGDFSLWAHAQQCGKDWSITIGGGTRSHIGAVAIGLPRPSLTDTEITSASVSSFCVPGHKDDEVARDAAYQLSSVLDCCVSVACGIHVDDASSEDVERLLQNYHALIEMLILHMKAH